MQSKMKYIAMAVLLVAVAIAPCAACAGSATGSGRPMTRQYDLKDFSEVKMGDLFGGVDADVTAADTYSISVTMPEDLFQYLDVSKSGQTLRITTRRILFGSDRPKVSVGMPDLYKADYSGGSAGRISGFKSSHDMLVLCSGGGNLALDFEAGRTEIDLSGGGTLTGRLVCLDCRINVSGGSRMELAGTGSGTTQLQASGGSQVLLGGLTVRKADVTMSGGANAVMSVTDQLGVNLSGGAGLRYNGNPQITRQIISGFSEFSRN